MPCRSSVSNNPIFLSPSSISNFFYLTTVPLTNASNDDFLHSLHRSILALSALRHLHVIRATGRDCRYDDDDREEKRHVSSTCWCMGWTGAQVPREILLPLVPSDSIRRGKKDVPTALTGAKILWLRFYRDLAGVYVPRCILDGCCCSLHYCWWGDSAKLAGFFSRISLLHSFQTIADHNHKNEKKKEKEKKKNYIIVTRVALGRASVRKRGANFICKIKLFFSRMCHTCILFFLSLLS